MNFTFDGNMSREVLESYLSRAVTAAGLVESTTLEDDLRVIKRLGIKFLGRASGVWGATGDDAAHFEKSRALAEKVHAQDPEIILQSCVFEYITPLMNVEKIPAYVFEAFGMPVEDRCFSWDDARMLDEDQELAGDVPMGDRGAMPDLNRQEARLWFYYRATKYIDCGYEALHMGQVHLYTANDRGMKKTYELFQLIRDYAAVHGRRHKVLLDAHTHGVSINGKLMFDYHAMPFTRAPLEYVPGKRLALVREGFSEGGENPNGWSGEQMPYLMEYDNWCGREYDDESKFTRHQLALMQWWGYDQIAYFANLPAEQRNHFIEYTYRWTQVNNPHAFFEVPFRRTLGNAPVKFESGLNRNYQLNNPSEKCPMGFGQEDVVKACWDDGDRLRKGYANPEHLIRFGAHEIYDPETGFKLPEKVVVFGSFQPMVGAVENDSNSEITRMYYVGDGTYALTVVMPFAGEYSYAISTYGTLSAVYGEHSHRAGSGGCGPNRFITKRDNSIVRFTFKFIDGIVRAEIVE